MFEENVLQRVKQLGLEIHTREMILNRESSVGDVTRYFSVLTRLETMGFRKWYYNENSMGIFFNSAIEVSDIVHPLLLRKYKLPLGV